MKPKFRKLSINSINSINNNNNSNSTINHCDQSLFPSNISTSFEMNNNDNSLVICDHNQSIESKLSMIIDCSNNDDHQQQRPTHHLAYHHDDIQPLSSYFKHQQQHHHPTHHHRCKSLFTMIAKLSFILLFMFNHHHHQCNCLTLTLLNDNNNSHNNNNNNDNNPIITDNKLKTIRFIRSYSEEFISSSEERERGLQFFGGISSSSSALNGGNSQLSSSSSLTLTSSSLTSSSTSQHHQQSTQKRISPYFDTETISTNVTISEGSSFVHLPCRVKQLGDRTLSWIRRQDFQILTVGTFTYTSDQRFQAIHRENSDDWSLQISYPKKKDAGIYECQISTMPKMSLFIQLNVVVSRAKILEGPTLYLSSGSTLNLTCSVKDTPEPPDYIFWYYNGQVINYGSPRGIKVHTEKSLETISKLLILNAQTNDSGNYSCTPSNAESAHVAVHVQNNANVAASIQHGKRSASREFNNNRNNGYGTMAASNRYEQSIFVLMIAICTMILMMALI